MKVVVRQLWREMVQGRAEAVVKKEPPYWPFRCKQCSRLVSNPRVTFNRDRIVDERGDCAEHGQGVRLHPLTWEDWLGEDLSPEDILIKSPLRENQ